MGERMKASPLQGTWEIFLVGTTQTPMFRLSQ